MPIRKKKFLQQYSKIKNLNETFRLKCIDSLQSKFVNIVPPPTPNLGEKINKLDSNIRKNSTPYI